MPRPESWEAVAKNLADRLEHAAEQCGEGLSEFGGEILRTREDVHRFHPDDFADDCPFCADTVAYRRYLARRAGKPYVPRSDV